MPDSASFTISTQTDQVARDLQWPRYNPSARLTLQFNDGSVPLNVTVDDERIAGTEELTSLALRFPL